MNKKDIAIDFLNLATAGKIDEAYDKYVSPHFKHHNPYFKGDRDSLRLAMKEAHQQDPQKLYEVKRVLTDEDLVAVHGRLIRTQPPTEIAVVHIFRFEDDLIIEEWEAGGPIPSDSVNENGCF